MVVCVFPASARAISNRPGGRSNWLLQLPFEIHLPRQPGKTGKKTLGVLGPRWLVAQGHFRMPYLGPFWNDLLNHATFRRASRGRPDPWRPRGWHGHTKRHSMRVPVFIWSRFRWFSYLSWFCSIYLGDYNKPG